jgi:ferredoxin
MRVSVDLDVCQGHARCARLAPQVFSLDEAGYVVLLREDVPAELEDGVRKAAAACPERAITIEE